jgi:hypothetical protein
MNKLQRVDDRLSLGGAAIALKSRGYDADRSWITRQIKAGKVTPDFPTATTARLSWRNLSTLARLAEEGGR